MFVSLIMRNRIRGPQAISMRMGHPIYRRMRSKNSSHGLLSKGKKKKISQQEIQMMVLLGLMTAVFVVCYLPLLVSEVSHAGAAAGKRSAREEPMYTRAIYP